MNLKFWQRHTPLEARQDSQTDALVQLLVNAAGGGTLANSSESGALEVASGLVGRCFASAKIKTARPLVVQALSAPVLGMIGRSLIRKGEAVFLIQVERGGVQLYPCSSWDISGGFHPESWVYTVNLSGPNDTSTITVRGESILHFKYAVEPERAWKGIGPLQAATAAARLDAETNTLLGDIASGPRGSLLPIPKNPDSSVDAIVENLKKLAGGISVVESMAGGWDDKAAKPGTEWDSKRIDPTTSASMVELRHAADLLALGACGVPIAFLEKADGTLLRESARILLTMTLIPLGRTCALELQDKLDAPGWPSTGRT